MDDREIDSITDTTVILDKLRELRVMRDDPKQNTWSDNSLDVVAARLFDRLDDLIISQVADLPEQWKGRHA